MKMMNKTTPREPLGDFRLAMGFPNLPQLVAGVENARCHETRGDFRFPILISRDWDFAGSAGAAEKKWMEFGYAKQETDKRSDSTRTRCAPDAQACARVAQRRGRQVYA
jgi:hypothetical protein